jgi:hypothetical protein
MPKRSTAKTGRKLSTTKSGKALASGSNTASKVRQIRGSSGFGAIKRAS